MAEAVDSPYTVEPTWLTERAVPVRAALLALGPVVIPPAAIAWADAAGKASGDVYIRLARFITPGQESVLAAAFLTAWRHDVVGFGVHHHAIRIGRIPATNVTARLVAIEAQDDYLRLLDLLATTHQSQPTLPPASVFAASATPAPLATEMFVASMQAFTLLANWLAEYNVDALAAVPVHDLARFRTAALRLAAARGGSSRVRLPRRLPTSLRPVNHRTDQ